MGIIKSTQMIYELQLILQAVLAASTLKGSIDEVPHISKKFYTIDNLRAFDIEPKVPIFELELGLMLNNQNPGMELWLKLIILSGIILGVIAIGGGLFYMYKRHRDKKKIYGSLRSQTYQDYEQGYQQGYHQDYTQTNQTYANY